MLTIVLPETDLVKEAEVNLEHSLLSLSKWEARTEKPFFSKDDKTPEETLDYMEEMVMGDPPEKFRARITNEHVKQVNEYLNSKQTATWFRNDESDKGPKETVTAELIYFWMLQFKIPFSCETWHVNRLMTLIRICSIKAAPPKKMSAQAQMDEMKRLNAERRAKLGSSG